MSAYEWMEKTKSLEPYEGIAGEYRIRLDANESFIDPGEKFRTEIIAAVGALPLNRYPDPQAWELRTKFAAFYGVAPENVVAGNGSDELISVILSGFLRQQDKVLLFSPDFSMYGLYGKIYEKQVIVAEKDADLCLNAEVAIAAINTHKPQAVLLSNPCSPTGLLLSRADVEKIVQSTNALVIIDEAYMDFADQSVITLTDQYANLMVLKTCSKALGLAAVRLGFAVGNREMIKGMHSVRSPYNVNALTQAIGCIIFSHPEYIRAAIGEMKAAKEQLYQGLLQMAAANDESIICRVFDSCTNFLFVEAKEADWLDEELRKASIVIRRMGTYLRITSGTPEENAELLQALAEITRRAKS